MITRFTHYNARKPNLSTKPQARSLFRLQRPVVTNKYNRTSLKINNSINDSILKLNDFTNNETWKLAAHAIINFSAIYFTLNWIYYRSIRMKIEEKDKDKKNDN